MTKRKSKRKISTKNKSYSPKDSPFYKLHSKKRLCELLGMSTESAKNLCIESSNYSTFEVEGKGGRKRIIECPNDHLDRIHTRIASLLCRITPPEFMHSGCKGRTHITNAKAHTGSIKVATTDIKSFYASTTKKMVFNLFYSNFSCSPDVSRILAELVTYDGHVPTGSRVSMPIALWANISMFNEFERLATKHNIKMTVFVDDVSFSGDTLNKLFVATIKKIAVRHGHTIHPKKTKLYEKDEIKVVTGVVIKGDEIKIKNEQHLKIYQDIEQWKALKESGFASSTLNNRLLGRLSSMSQVEPKMKDKARSIRDVNSNLFEVS